MLAAASSRVPPRLPLPLVIRPRLRPVTLLADALQPRRLRRIPPERLTRKRPIAGRAVAQRIRLDPPARDPNAAITPQPHGISLAREGLGSAGYRAGFWLKKAPTAKLSGRRCSRDDGPAAGPLTQWPWPLPPWFPLPLPSPWLPFWSGGPGCPSGDPWGGASEFVDGAVVGG